MKCLYCDGELDVLCSQGPLEPYRRCQNKLCRAVFDNVLYEKIEAMAAVIAKLPKTKDGVGVIPSVDVLYRPMHVGNGEYRTMESYDTAPHLIASSYSTRELSDAAINCTTPQPCGHCPRCKGEKQ